MIFLDTKVVSEFLREGPDPKVLAWSDGVEREAICTASVVEAELRVGIERLPDGRRKRAFVREPEAFLVAAFGDRVYPFDRAAARFYAEFMAARAKAGRPIASPDALIAATACSPRATRRISRGAGWRW